MKRSLLFVVAALVMTLASCGGSSSGNPMTEGVPPCSDLKAGVDMADFEEGCMRGDTIVASLGYDCETSGDELVYVAPDEDAGEIYFGLPGKKAQKAAASEDFWLFKERC